MQRWQIQLLKPWTSSTRFSHKSHFQYLVSISTADKVSKGNLSASGWLLSQMSCCVPKTFIKITPKNPDQLKYLTHGIFRNEHQRKKFQFYVRLEFPNAILSVHGNICLSLC